MRALLVLTAAYLLVLGIVAWLVYPTPTSSPEPRRPVPSKVPATSWVPEDSREIPAPTVFAFSALVLATPKPPPTPKRKVAAPKPTGRIATAIVSGTASTYGPGYDGYLALPQGPGFLVRICGAGGCLTKRSNDTGPVASLHRVADLDVATFERVCGLPWTRGLCRVTVEFLQ